MAASTCVLFVGSIPGLIAVSILDIICLLVLTITFSIVDITIETASRNPHLRIVILMTWFSVMLLTMCLLLFVFLLFIFVLILHLLHPYLVTHLLDTDLSRFVLMLNPIVLSNVLVYLVQVKVGVRYEFGRAL